MGWKAHYIQINVWLKVPYFFLCHLQIPGSDSSQQSWFMPSSEASALTAEEIEGVDSGFSGKTKILLKLDYVKLVTNVNFSIY